MLAIICDGQTGAEATWKPMTTSGSTEKSTEMAGLANDDRIVEPTCCKKPDASLAEIDDCNCPKLSEPTEDWAELICEKELEDHKVVDPNFCMLLCDNHIRTSFGDKIDETGNNIWVDNDGTPVTEL